MMLLPSLAGRVRLRNWRPIGLVSTGLIWLAAVFGPAIAAVLLYYGPVLSGGLSQLPVRGDAHFYVYQLARAAEEGGRWWNIGHDELDGFPYPTMAAKHPGLYEGVDLMVIGSATGRWLDPITNYHAMIVLVLTANGWVAMWMVRRMGGSWLSASLAVLLITSNLSTAGRLNGHLHLFKHCWTLLSIVAFLQFLERPTYWFALLLGASVALVIQGSFYIGYFVVVAFTAGFILNAIVGRCNLTHIKTGIVAALMAMTFTAALTVPVWLRGPAADAESVYFHRDRSDIWHLAAELWQYVVPPGTDMSIELLRGAHHDAITLVGPLETSPLLDRPLRVHLTRSGLGWEGWHYPGVAMLLTVSAYLVVRLRGIGLGESTRFIDRAMALCAFWVMLSLAGGPGALLFDLVPCFRAYGRAGLVAVGLLCAIAPVIAERLIFGLRQRIGLWAVTVIAAGFIVLAGRDVLQAKRAFMNHPMRPVPGWVNWLKEQPADVKLAAFGGAFDTSDDWHWRALHYRLIHGHATLNGAENSLFDRDLEQFNSLTCWMNVDGLWFVISLGYEVIAIDDGFRETHPWIERLPWLEVAGERNGWLMLRYRKDW